MYPANLKQLWTALKQYDLNIWINVNVLLKNTYFFFLIDSAGLLEIHFINRYQYQNSAHEA